jgi:hypothetical protein
VSHHFKDTQNYFKLLDSTRIVYHTPLKDLGNLSGYLKVPIRGYRSKRGKEKGNKWAIKPHKYLKRSVF